jgi:hypothetical protein
MTICKIFTLRLNKFSIFKTKFDHLSCSMHRNEINNHIITRFYWQISYNTNISFISYFLPNIYYGLHYMLIVNTYTECDYTKYPLEEQITQSA